MSFVGITIMYFLFITYAFMQAVGMVDDHFVGCNCYKE
jgi:3-methyladenine DNA glycosylase Tag